MTYFKCMEKNVSESRNKKIMRSGQLVGLQNHKTSVTSFEISSNGSMPNKDVNV